MAEKHRAESAHWAPYAGAKRVVYDYIAEYQLLSTWSWRARLRAEAHVVSRGKKLGYIECDIADQDGKHQPSYLAC